MIIIQKFQAKNHLAQMFPPRRRERSGQLRNLSPTVFASVAKDYRPSTPPSSRAQRGDPSLRFYGLPLKGLDCHVGMEPPRSDGKKSSVIRSAAWRSITHTDDTVRVWTATSAWSLLAVTHTSIIVI